VNLRELEIFHALMKAGTTVRAATALCMSQPAVSKALKHLESRMGIRLFERVSGRLRPTPEGQTLYRQVKTVFGRLETIERLAQDIRQGRNGVISIAATPTVATTLVAEAVARFRRRHPDACIIFRSIRSPDVARRVADGEASFGLCHLPLDTAGVECEDLLPLELVCLVQRQHPLARLPVVRLGDLVAHPLVSYRTAPGIGAAVSAAFRAAGLEKSIDIQTSLSATASALVARGAAVGLHDPLTMLFAPTGELVMRRVEPAVPMTVKLLRSPDFPNSAIAGELLTELRQVAREAELRLREVLRRGADDAPPPDAMNGVTTQRKVA